MISLISVKIISKACVCMDEIGRLNGIYYAKSVFAHFYVGKNFALILWDFFSFWVFFNECMNWSMDGLEKCRRIDEIIQNGSK